MNSAMLRVSPARVEIAGWGTGLKAAGRLEFVVTRCGWRRSIGFTRRREADQRARLFLVIPAKAGIQPFFRRHAGNVAHCPLLRALAFRVWIPAFAGMTIGSMVRAYPHSRRPR